MANNVQLGVSVVDNTKQGLSSAFNNTTKMTAKMAKQLVLEVNVAFPNIASKTKDLQSQLSKAFRAMGNIDFVGNRLGKKGNVLSMLGFDGKALRSDMSLDAVKQHLARLKEIQAKLNDNTLVSGSKGEAFKKEQKNISNAIKALEQYKNTLDLIFRTNSKYNTKLTSATAAKQVVAADKAVKLEDNLLRRRYQYELSQLSKKESILGRIASLEVKRNNSSTITSKTARLNEERAAIGGMITLYEQLIAIDKKHGADTSANQAKLNALRQEHTQIKNNIEATKKAEAAERARLRASSALLGIAKNINQYNNQRNEIKNLGGIQRLNQEYSVVNKTRKAWEAYRQKLVEAGRNANFAAIDRRIAALRQEEKQLYANRIAAQERNRVNRVNAQLEKQYRSQGQLLGRLGSLASRYFSIYTVARFANNVAKTTGFFQQQQVALEGIIGSASKATTIFNDIQSFALQSPFQTKELVDFTKKLSAFGIEPDKLFPTVKELADISTGLGVDMGRIILAYGQVKSASVLRGQELRQFTEAGIPMVQALADKFTKMNGELVTTADIFEMISKRQVSFEVVADVLSDMTKEGGRFYKMQENVTNTLYGQIQKLKDLWTVALKDIGNSAGGFFNGVVSLLQKVVSNAKTVATALAAAFAGNWIGKNIHGIFRIMTHLKAYIRLLRVAATLNKSAFIGFGLGAALAVGAGAFVKIKDELTKVKRKMQEISDSFTKETNKMIDGVNALIKRMRAATVGSKEWNDALETLKNNYGEYLDVNDAVLQKVIQGIDLNKEEKKSFDDLSESIAAAIKLKKEYEELTAKKNESENLMSAEFAGMFKRNSKMLVSQIGEKGNLNEFFGTNYDKAINPQISSRVEAIFKSALDTFTSYGKTSFEDFKTIFKTMLNNEFIGSDLKGNSAETIIDSYLKTTFSSISGSSVFAEYLNIVGKLSGEGTSLFDSMVRINKLFEDNKFSPTKNTPLGEHKEREGFYRDIFGKGLTSELNAIVNQEGTKKSKNALLELMAIVADTEKGTYDVYVAFDNLLNAVADPERRRVIADAANLYKKHTDALTDDEMALAKNLESITEFSNSVVQLDRKNNFKTQEYFEKWDPSVRGDKTIEQTREEISTEYQSLKKELDTYLSKDAEIFANEIKVIQEKMKVLEKIAGSNFYNIDLSDKTRSGAKQLPPELADFLSSLKNAYQRYNESVDKGGIGIGLNYVRTNEMFQEMFGEFFGGAEGEKFKALSGMKVGSQTVGELLSGKFLDGLEDGVIDFKAAALALAEDLEKTGIKSYKQAGKQLRQWVDSTISKDSLNATMNELEKTIKDLTNSFEKVNKEVDLYRKLQENGTVKALDGQLGVTAAMAATPDSVRMQGQIQTLISSLNNQLTAQNIAPLSLGNLSRIDEVYNAIENLGKITMMNNKAFDGTALGQIGGDVANLLKQLLETLIKEAASISGEVYSGNAMNDLVANATKRLGSGQFALAQKANIASNLGTYDMAAIKALVNATQEDAKKIFDQFIKDNNFDVIARANGGKIKQEDVDKLREKLQNIAKGFPALLRDELLGKIDELNDAIDVYNAKVSAPGSMLSAFNDYKNARSEASARWLNESNKNYRLQKKRKQYEEGDLYLTPDQLANLDAEIFASNERLKEMGGSVDALTEKLKQLAIENLQKSAQEAQTELNAILSAANSVIDVFKSLISTVNKVWDIMSDGDVPEGLKDTEAFLNDFGEAFNNLIAPIMAVMAAVVAFTVVVAVAGTTTAAVFGALIGLAAIFAIVIAAFQQHDRNIEHSIEDLKRQVEDFEYAAERLNSVAERMTGIDKLKNQVDALGQSLSSASAYAEMARLEEEKKNTDEEKVKEYENQAFEASEEFENGMKGILDELISATEDWSSAMSDAIRSAFQNGDNAARSFRASIKEMMGDVVQSMLEMAILQPLIEDALQEWTNSDALKQKYTKNVTTTDDNGEQVTVQEFDADGYTKELLSNINDPEKAEDAYNSMQNAGDAYIDAVENLPDFLKDAFKFNSDTSSLSGGISGITEDTARTLEGLANSMLMQMILANRELSIISQSGFAQVQVSWFNDMLQQARATRTASEQIKQILDETRNGVRPLKVEVM